MRPQVQAVPSGILPEPAGPAWATGWCRPSQLPPGEIHDVRCNPGNRTTSFNARARNRTKSFGSRQLYKARSLRNGMEPVIRTHTHNLDARLRAVEEWKIPGTTIHEIRRFVDDLGIGKVNRGVQVSVARRLKYLDLLKTPLEFLRKPTTRVTARDIERFERALISDEIRSRFKKKPYSHSTKVDTRMALKIFLRWRLGPAKATQLAGWLDTHDKFKTPDFLKEPEVDRLYRACHTSEQRFVIAVLFDSGARAQEFLNLRVEDVQLPEGKDNFLRITLKEEYSKTKGRTIALYWRHTLEAVREYLTGRIATGLRPTDPVFGGTYDGMRMFLARLGPSVLQRHVHPHLLRHTSATFYANKLNRQELCYRYGWAFSSNMPDIYISRAGMETKDLDQKFTQTELSTLKDDLARVTQDNSIKTQRIEDLQKSVDEMRQGFELVADLLQANPDLQDLEAAIRRRRGSG